MPRGGNRGGNRPRTVDGHRRQVYLDAESEAIAKDLGAGNVSAGIRRALAMAKSAESSPRPWRVLKNPHRSTDPDAHQDHGEPE